MTIIEYYIVYPEGEIQELEAPLKISQIVDLNGRPLPMPLPSPRVIAYRVMKIRQSEDRGMQKIFHYVELIPTCELQSHCY